MASTRAFKNLASLRHGFEEPLADEDVYAEAPEAKPIAVQASVARPVHDTPHLAPALVRAPEGTGPNVSPSHPVSPITGKVDRRRLRKVLKTPSVSLSVAVRAELHEDVSAMLFARKTTWIALLDTMLSDYVARAKETGHFPK